MKNRFISLFLLLAILFSFSSCYTETPKENSMMEHVSLNNDENATSDSISQEIPDTVSDDTSEAVSESHDESSDADKTDFRHPELGDLFEYYFPGSDCVMMLDETLPLYVGNFYPETILVSWDYEKSNFEQTYTVQSGAENIKKFNLTIPEEIKLKFKVGDRLDFIVHLDEYTDIYSTAYIISGEGDVSIKKNEHEYKHLYLRRGLKLLFTDDVETQYLNILLARVETLPDVMLFGDVTVYISGDLQETDPTDCYFTGAAIYICYANIGFTTNTGEYTYYIVEDYLIVNLAFNIQEFIYLNYAGDGVPSMKKIGTEWFYDVTCHDATLSDNAEYKNPPMELPCVVFTNPAHQDLANAWTYSILGTFAVAKKSGMCAAYFEKVDEYFQRAEDSVALMRSMN